jgi:hypothetical protein
MTIRTTLKLSLIATAILATANAASAVILLILLN